MAAAIPTVLRVNSLDPDDPRPAPAASLPAAAPAIPGCGPPAIPGAYSGAARHPGAALPAPPARRCRHRSRHPRAALSPAVAAARPDCPGRHGGPEPRCPSRPARGAASTGFRPARSGRGRGRTRAPPTGSRRRPGRWPGPGWWRRTGWRRSCRTAGSLSLSSAGTSARAALTIRMHSPGSAASWVRQRWSITVASDSTSGPCEVTASCRARRASPAGSMTCPVPSVTKDLPKRYPQRCYRSP